MKKLLVIILTLTILSSCFMFSTSAEDITLTLDEAEKLVKFAHDIYFDMIYGEFYKIKSDDEEKFAYLKHKTNDLLDNPNDKFFTSGPHTYIQPTGYFILDKTDSVKDAETQNFEAYKVTKYIFDGTEYKFEKNGDFAAMLESIYSSEGLSKRKNDKILEVLCFKLKDGFAYLGTSWISYPFFRAYLGITDLKVNGENATANKITVERYPDNDGTHYQYYSQEIKFTKTANGWRISDDTSEATKINSNPITGDSSPAVVGLALAALVSLAAPFVVKRRRVR